MMLRGLQAGFGYRIGTETLADVRRLGCDGVRIDCQPLAPFEVRVMAEEVLAAGLKVLVIVREAAQLEHLPPDIDIEVGNEPDLNGPPPRIYAEQVRAVRDAAVAKGLRTWAGVVSNLNTRGFDYLEMLVPLLPLDVRITVHRYPHDQCFAQGFEVPHPGFASRDEEVATLKRLIGVRPWGVSEFGYHTARRPIKCYGVRLGSRRWTDVDVAEQVRREWLFWQGQGATFAVLYQLNDGDEDVALSRYGIRRTDGTWKPVAATFRDVDVIST